MLCILHLQLFAAIFDPLYSRGEGCFYLNYIKPMKSNVQLKLIKVSAVLHLVLTVIFSIVLYFVLNAIQALYQDFGAFDSLPFFTEFLLNGGAIILNVLLFVTSMLYGLFVFIRFDYVKKNARMFLYLSVGLLLMISLLVGAFIFSLMSLGVYFPLSSIWGDL